MAEVDANWEATFEQLKLFLPTFRAGAERLVVEVRAFDVWQFGTRRANETGFFEVTQEDGRIAFANALKRLVTLPPERQPSGIYSTVNGVDPVLLAKVNNKLKVAKDKGQNASDKHVVARRWIPIDADPAKPFADISATDDEKAAARLLIDGVREDLDSLGWPIPLFADSGNGYHVWARVDLPADDGGTVQRFLKALARRHNTSGAKIDTTLFNASRILKIPGTWARKGENLPDRPHRFCRVLEVREL